MLLLDTNVVSEAMRPDPDAGVRQWLDSHARVDLWISSVTAADIRVGIELLPRGKRRDQLRELAEQVFLEEFRGRCLPFDLASAGTYAEIVARRTGLGRPISVEDAQIAAIALTGGLDLATRNTKDFDGIDGLRLVNPWSHNR